MVVNSTVLADELKFVEIGWSVVAALLSIIGNTVLLFASIRRHAIKLDRITIVLLENLAVGDLGFVFFTILPRAVHILQNNDGTLFGHELLHKITVLPRLVCTAINISLIPILNFCKLLCLLYPLRVRNYRYKDGYKLVAVLWSGSVMVCAGIMVWTNFLSSFPDEIFIAVAVVLFVLIVLILTTTIGLLLTVHKARGLTRQGFVSVILISIVFLVCYIAMWTANILFSFAIFRIFYSIAYLSCFSNTLIYYRTIRSFKEFVDNNIKLSVSRSQ